MHQDLIALGQLLRQRRQERNLSLKEIENATSIRIHFLSAIEEGHLAKLISPIYAQGFIKKYATYLELDADAILRDHPHVMKMLSEFPPTRQDFSYGLGSVEVRNTGTAEIKWLPSALWVGISALVIVGGWIIGRYFGFF